MLVQTLLVVLLAVACSRAAPQPLDNAATAEGIETIGDADISENVYGGVLVKLFKSNNRGCNGTPSFKTARILGSGHCLRVSEGQTIGSTMVTQNWLKKDCTLTVYNTKDCTAGNFFVVPSGITNCWAQDVQSVKITCPRVVTQTLAAPTTIMPAQPANPLHPSPPPQTPTA